MKKFIIDEFLRDNLINYLETRPYKEVAAGIVALINLKEINIDQKEKINKPACQ